MNPLDGVSFSVPGLKEKQRGSDVRIWSTEDGDGVGLLYFAKAPDIPGDLDHVTDLRVALSRIVSASGGAIVEAHVTMIDGCKALTQCVKVPQEGSGMTYVGSITLPFREFSFVLKIQCEERGMTGTREAVLLEEKLRAGEVQVDPDGDGIAGWMKDPYDVRRTSGLAKTLADSDQYDARFADHPLSRARRFVSAAEESIRVSDTIKAALPFVYRSSSRRRRPWWKLW